MAMSEDKEFAVTDGSVMPRSIVEGRLDICDMLLGSPLPKHELIRNVGLYMLPMDVKRLLFFADLYQRIVNVPGIIVEFGTRWGQNLAILQSLRAILEPYHHRRLILGFDTFEGFPEPTREDGSAPAVIPGAYRVTEGYLAYLEKLLGARELQSPMAEVKKFQLVKGDASESFAKYLRDHPETVIALAYFDMDLYQPTRDCLKLLRSRLTKGSVVGFDELNNASFPGETVAVAEVIGLDNIELRRSPFSADECYFVA